MIDLVSVWRRRMRPSERDISILYYHFTYHLTLALAFVVATVDESFRTKARSSLYDYMNTELIDAVYFV